MVTLPAVEVSKVDATSFSVVRSQRSSQAGKSMRVYNQPLYKLLASDSPTEIFDQVRTQVMRSYELMLTLYRITAYTSEVAGFTLCQPLVYF